MPILFRIVLAVLFLAQASGVSRADIPPPGTHGVTKTWSRVGATVVNFSPYSSDRKITALTPDTSGGVWYGLGNSLEHIDDFGRMREYNLSREWLWQIRGIAYDHFGRLWFSLGESGRIGTIGPDGQLKSRIVVARKYFPDIRAIAFDENDTLWFDDRGRQSIGRQTAAGRVREVPIPDKAFIDDFRTAGLEICHSKVWIAAGGAQSDTMYSVEGDLRAFRSVRTWRKPGWSSIACDRHGQLWFTHSAYQRVSASVSGSVEGHIDRERHLHERPATFQDETVHAGAHGAIWFTGFRGASPADWNSSALVLARASGNGLVERTLPVAFGDFGNSLTTTTDTCVWLSVTYPHSVVRLQFRSRRQNRSSQSTNAAFATRPFVGLD